MAYPYNFAVGGGYCNVADVQALFKNLASFSRLDQAEIEARIFDAAVEIDNRVNRVYLVPVAGDAPALQLLRVINDRLAGAVIHEVISHRTQGHDDAPGTAGAPATPGVGWRAWALGLLGRIATGDIRFFLAPLQVPSALPQFPTGHGATFNPDNDAALNPDNGPAFQRGGRGSLGALGGLM